jgi:hypothetical protein
VLGHNSLGMIPSSWRGASPAFSSGGHTTMPRYHRIPAAQIPRFTERVTTFSGTRDTVRDMSGPRAP